MVTDTVVLDTLSLVDGSIKVFDDSGILLSPTTYRVFPASATLVFITPPVTNWIRVYYRVLPLNFSSAYSLRLTGTEPGPGALLTATPLPQPLPQSIDSNQTLGLQTNGLISRGMVAGNQQNLSSVSNLNLQMNGQLKPGLYVEAMLSDQNIPLQPNGYTQQIQDFDQIYVKIYDSVRYVKMGDIMLQHAGGYYLRLNRKIQGGEAGFNQKTAPNGTKYASGAGAIARGIYHKNTLTGIEGVTGPYQLTGARNETYIVVLAGTERVYLDGVMLQRGEQAHYIINYNTAEITFMPQVVITAASRISVEFEYSDRQYNRYLAYGNTGTTTQNGALNVTFLSETDAKNQPVDQPLTNSEQQILANAGNDPLQALVPNFDSTGFDKNYVRYRITDTLVNGTLYDSVFVYSINPSEAVYQVGFAYVGENRGYYQPLSTGTNGRSYQWVAPVNGVLQGSYLPVKLLVAPRAHQIMVVNATHQWGKTHTAMEAAFTRADSNTFAQWDNQQNYGMALKTEVKQQLFDEGRKSFIGLEYQYGSANFLAFDRFREVEFHRNWNLPTTITNPQHLLTASFDYKNRYLTQLKLSSSLLHHTAVYQGLKHDAVVRVNLKNTQLNTVVSLLNTSGELPTSRFYRHNLNWSIPIRKLTTTLTNQVEDNRIVKAGSDTLASTSQKFVSSAIALNTTDTLTQGAGLQQLYRTDYAAQGLGFTPLSASWQTTANARLRSKHGHQILLNSTYRNVQYQQVKGYATQVNEYHFLSRITYRANWLKKTNNVTLYYENGTAMESSREFVYVEVAAGQGLYVWNDYNHNGVTELNEFEVAPIPQEANYIRVMVPTSDQMRVYSAQFNGTLVTNTARLWADTKGITKFLSRWQNSLSYRSVQKQTNSNLAARLNPFVPNFADTTQINSSGSVRNTLSFNRSHPVFGADWVYSKNQQKTLLTYGVDKSDYWQQQLNMRWNINSWFVILNGSEVGLKRYNSEYFASKNYQIKTLANMFEGQFQPNQTLRNGVFYTVKYKTNQSGLNEQAQLHETGTELKVNSPKKGSLNVRVSAIYTSYSGVEGTSVSYEMLEGNLPGLNYRWSVNVARNLNKYLKLTLNYTGRQLPASGTIHTGQLNLSAFF